MTLESTFFEVVRHDAVAELRMNRPEKANGMSPDFWADLPRLVGELDDDTTLRAIVLTGAGRNFSGGLDLASFQGIMTEFQREPGRAAHAFYRRLLRMQDALTCLEETRLPVIAAIQGACVGGGIDLVSACDVRLASRNAWFAIEEINIGMAADVGTLQRLPKLIAPGIAAELALTGRRFSPEESLGWGFVNAIHEDAEAVRHAALEMAATIASKSPLAIAGIKRSMVYVRDHSVADGLDQIATWNAGMLRPEDLMRAMQARMAKSEAKFADLLAS